MKHKKIILVYPASDFYLHYPGPDFDLDGYRCVPPGLLSIATVVHEAGYQPVIIDCRLYPKKEIDRILLRELDGALAVGFSVMTCQVRHGLYLSRLAKERSSLPVIWGGIHSSLFPEMTEEDPLIDYVIYSEAENSFLELLNYISNGNIPLDSIRGLVWKKEREIIKNNPADTVDINKLPLPEYGLLDIEKYIVRRLLQGDRVRGLDIITSRGCPYRCSFCTNTFLLGRKWRPLNLDRITALMDNLIERYNLNNLWFVDDFFFGQKERPLKIASHLKERFGNISWEADIRADNFRQGFVDDGYLRQLHDCGCHSLRIGAESGSNRVLQMLKKDISVEQIITAVKKCIEHNILPVLFFMIGIPGESKEEALSTAQFVFFLKDKFPKVRIFGPNFFRPYPGSELYEEILKSGFRASSSLREWGEDLLGGYLDTNKLPWIKDSRHFMEGIIFYINMFLAYKGQHPSPGLRKFFGMITVLRNRINFWQFRLEARLVAYFKILKRKLTKKKLTFKL